MKFKVARADRGWKIFVVRARARPLVDANSRNEFQLVDRRKMAPGYPGRSWATWPSPLSYLLTTWELAICLQISCNASSRFNARGFLSAGVFFEAKRFLGLLRPPTSSNHFVDLSASLLLPLQRFIGSWTGEVTVCDSSCMLESMLLIKRYFRAR